MIYLFLKLLYHIVMQIAMHKFPQFCITLYIAKCTTELRYKYGEISVIYQINHCNTPAEKGSELYESVQDS